MFHLLLTALCFLAQGSCSTDQCHAENCRMQLTLPGDYIIGGLFRIHDELYHGHRELEVPKCKRFSYNGYLQFQSLRFAVEEINNSNSLLPNVTLGYLIFDECEIVIDILGTLAFVSSHQEISTEAGWHENSYQQAVTAVIGPSSSDAAVITNKILSLFEVPQISFGASSDELSDKMRYPTFLRTTPSNANQIEAIVLLIQAFGWNWITIIASNSNYGENGRYSVIAAATARGICVASHHTIPIHVSKSKQEISDIVGKIREKRVNVIVVFAHAPDTKDFFQVAVGLNITGKVWIFSEASSVIRSFSEIPNIRSIGTILGIAIKKGRIPGYETFVFRDITACNQDNCKGSQCSNLQQEMPGNIEDNCRAPCDKCVPCTSDSVKLELQYSEWRSEFNVHSAVYATAHGLHQLLQCDSGECKKKAVYPRQFLKELKRVNFSLDDMQIYFDENGNPPIGYDIIYWEWMNETVSFKVIGSYKPNPGHLQIDASLIKWSSPNGRIPTSNCSRECEVGQIKVTVGSQLCCFICKDCTEGTFQKDNECLPCNPSQWSSRKSTACQERSIVYLKWNKCISIVLAMLAGIGLLLKASITITFIVYFDTPIVRAAGGKLCFVLLLALAVSCSTVFFFFGEPSTQICIGRKLIFMISYKICLACVMVRSFQLVVIFKMASRMPKAFGYWVKYNGQYLFLLICTAVELFTSILYILFKFSVLVRNYDISKTEVILMCSYGNLFFTILPLFGITLFSLICFVFAYLGKDLPKNYNEAKCIAFSMALVLISWVSLILVIISNLVSYVSAIEAAVILLNSYSITVGFFLPKCYIILFKPQSNTVAFFQTCLQEYSRSKNDQHL